MTMPPITPPDIKVGLVALTLDEAMARFHSATTRGGWTRTGGPVAPQPCAARRLNSSTTANWRWPRPGWRGARWNRD